MFMHYAERYCTLRCGRKAINVLLSFCSCWVLADGEHCFLIIIIVIFFFKSGEMACYSVIIKARYIDEIFCFKPSSTTPFLNINENN